MKYGNRSPWKSFFYSPISIGVATVILYFIIRGGLNIHEKANLAEQRYEQAQAELTDLQSQKVSLTASIDNLSNQDGMEAALREKYHAVKDGESVAVIIGDSSSTDEDGGLNQTQATSSVEHVSWWRHVLQAVGL